MTQDEIMEMARQTGWHDALLDVSFVLPTLTDFAKLVAAKAISEFDSHTLYREGYVNGYAFGEAAGKQAIAELESQEPVAWVAEDVCKGQVINGRPRKIWWECEKGVGKPIYTHPPQPEQKTSADDFFKTIADKNPKPFLSSQRTWIGLTDDEFNELYDRYVPLTCYALLIEKVEAKLKEKNT